MKKTLLLIAFVFVSAITFSQNFEGLQNIPLDDSISCKKAEPYALTCSEYILSRTAKKDDYHILRCTQFLLEWMEKTPEYTFTLGGGVFDAIGKDETLIPIYLACQTKLALTDHPKPDDPDFELNYTTMLLNYCEDPTNKVKINSKLKKYIQAKNDGKLREKLAEK